MTMTSEIAVRRWLSTGHRPPAAGAATGTREPERAANAHLALQPHATAHQPDDPPAQRQTEAGALLRGGIALSLLERLEDALAILRGDAHAGVRDRDRHVVPVDPRLDDDLAAVGRELHGVAQQVDARPA